MPRITKLLPSSLGFSLILLSISAHAGICRWLTERNLSNGLSKKEIKYVSTQVELDTNRSNYWIWGKERLARDERIIVLVDAKLDNHLAKWFEKESLHKYKDIASIDALAERVELTFFESLKEEPNKKRVARHEKLTGIDILYGTNRITKLGDYIKNGIGECRHQSVLMAVALLRSSIHASVLTGYLRAVTSAGKVLNGVGHALVQYEFEGKSYIVDPINRVDSIPKPSDGDIKLFTYFDESLESDVDVIFSPDQHQFTPPLSRVDATNLELLSPETKSTFRERRKSRWDF